MPFQQHPSRESVELFKPKPYQGQRPERANGYIDRLIQSDRPKLALVSAGVLRDMRDINKRSSAEHRLMNPWFAN